MPMAATVAPTNIYQNWDVANKGQWGSFWFKIERTTKKVGPYYYYFIYCYSNSYLNNNGQSIKAITFIDKPVITMTWKTPEGVYYRYPISLSSAIFDWEETKICYFYSTDHSAKFTATWSNIYPYDYSKVAK